MNEWSEKARSNPNKMLAFEALAGLNENNCCRLFNEECPWEKLRSPTVWRPWDVRQWPLDDQAGCHAAHSWSLIGHQALDMTLNQREYNIALSQSDPSGVFICYFIPFHVFCLPRRITISKLVALLHCELERTWKTRKRRIVRDLLVINCIMLVWSVKPSDPFLMGNLRI